MLADRYGAELVREPVEERSRRRASQSHDAVLSPVPPRSGFSSTSIHLAALRSDFRFSLLASPEEAASRPSRRVGLMLRDTAFGRSSA